MTTTETKGGFVDGVPDPNAASPVVTGGCCGSADDAGGCCGEPADQGTDCCGEPVTARDSSSRCCA